MTAHSDRIRQAEHAAHVYEDAPWAVGDVAHNPHAKDMPDGAVIIDALGNPWHLIAGEWFTSGVERDLIPKPGHGPFEVVWLPKEDA